MIDSPEFDFGRATVASAYDDVLVPVLFRPWAERLIEEHGEWNGRVVLDLATGTGVVARLLADRVGAEGRVIAADINAEMLSIAKQRCATATAPVHFVESPAHPLDLPDDAVDAVVCQQGFQFFPDRGAAAREIRRVLSEGGEAIVTTWRPVEECEFFGAICRALESIDEPEIAEAMRIPFDHMPAPELRSHFESAGFARVEARSQTQDLVVPGGPEHTIEVACATPIGPQIHALSDDQQARFRSALVTATRELSEDGTTIGRMVSNMIVAEV